MVSHPLNVDPSMLLSRGNSSALSDSAMVSEHSEPSSPKAGATQMVSPEPDRSGADLQPKAGPVDATSKDMGREASKDPLATAGPEGLESMGMAVAHPAGQEARPAVAPKHSVLQQHFDYFDM